MKTIEVFYSAYVEVDVPDDWDLKYREDDILDLAISHWQKYPDGTWEVVGEVG